MTKLLSTLSFRAFLLFALVLFTTVKISAQSFFIPTAGTSSITTCSGTLYDWNGTGTYGNGYNGYMVIYPATAGSMIRISGTSSGESCCDYVQVFQGVNGALVGQYQMGTAIPTITSNAGNGALTVRFVSDGSVTGAGPTINITCITNNPSAPTSIASSVPAICNVGSSATLTAQGAVGTVYWYTGGCGTTLVGTGNPITVTPGASTTYFARNFNGGLFSTTCASYTLNVSGTPAAPSTSNVNITCGNTATLTATGGGGTLYSWYTNSNATGAVGSGSPFVTPSLTSSTTYYVTSSTTSSASQIFNYTGSVQTWTVPAGVTSISFTADGAQGGASSAGYGSGGLGGRVQGTLNVTPGQVLNIYVGGTASGVTGGWNGGGNGPTSYTTWGGGGGGATDVRIGGTSLTNRVLVAAGGGGAGYNCGGNTNHGGGGGGTTGLMGWQCSSQSGSVGLGGTPTAGGASSGALGTAGTLGQGGNGYTIYGGGGGGGYYGGGGGSYGGGGGGSSWVNTTNVPSPSYTSNVVSGNGTLTFSWTGIGCQSSTVPAVVSVSTMAAPTSTNATVGCGSTVTLTATGGGGSGYAWYTNSNATGQVGSAASYTTPTLSTSTTYYVSAANSVSGSQTLNFTGGVQTWTVPAGVTSITFTANGASGGNSSAGYGTGGLGGRVQGILNVTPGQVLNIYVGGTASGTTGGWNGGGNGPTSYPTWGGGGGGATDVRIGGTSLNDRVLVAAGGGGAGYNCSTGNHGGGGGGTTGISGFQCSAQTSWVGLGGTPSAGGTSLGGGGGAGTLGQGGNGNTTYGGGGGGGYFGGGGASYGGGGGGSSWVNATSVPSPVHTANIVSGNGSFTFSWSGIGCQSSVVPVVVTVNPATTPTASGTSITCGQTATLSASSNATLTWYANSNGTGQLGTGTTFTTPSLTSSTTYYVQAGGGSCGTAIVAVPVTVSSNIASPTVNNLTVGCGQTAVITASGANSPYTYLWYNNSGGGSLIGSGTTYTSPALTSNTTYYVAQGTPGNGSQTFSYTGAVQTFTAPVSGTYTLDLYGAQGGTTSQFTGGLGGQAQGTINLTAGQTINIYVGEQPSTTTGGWNGGGNSGGNGRGGGGASDIRVGGTALNNRVVVAAGGGAGGLTSTGYTGSNGAIGGGTNGNASTGSSGGTSSGGAGTQSAGGTSTGCCGVGTAGTLGIGGNGANGLSGCSSYTDGWGGGGGGGYYGGGGGGNCGGGVGGGGGSSFIGGITGGTTTAGVRTGHGQVTISWVGTGCSSSLVPVVVTVNAASTPAITAATVNCGQTATLSASSNGSLVWYTSSNGTGQVATGSTFTTPVLNGSTTYYVQAGIGGCASQIIPVTATISMAAPVVASATVGCGQSTVLAATGGTNYIWYSNAQGSTQLGTGSSYTTPSLTGTSTYYVQNWTGNPTTQFYVNSLSTAGSFVTDHNAQSGDDRGGIAVTQQYYYYVGDNNTVRYDMPGLSNPISYTRRDGIFSDISGSGTLYTLWNSSLNSEPVGTCTSFTVNAVRGLNADCSLGGTTIATSQSFTMGSCSDAAVFSGHGFVILFTGTGGNPANTYFKISLPSGTVTNLGSYTLTAAGAENWARWGIAEFDGTAHRVVYVQNASTISRLNLTNGAVSTVQSFSTLSDMACITYAPWYNRWYFHHEGGSQFGGSSETAGYADGTHTFNAANLCQSSLTPVTVTVNAATTPSVNGASINCGQTAALTASSNGAITWYTNSNGTGQIATGTSFNAVGLTSSITYYVQAGTGACASSIVAVPVTVNALAAPVVSGTTNLCVNGSGTTTLTASGSPSGYVWYANANATGQLGTNAAFTTPNLSTTTTYYVQSSTPQSGSQTFSYTGGVQTFTAPITGNYTIDLYGAQGGSTSQYTGGLGGRSQGTINLTAGQTINIYVGGQPSTTAGGWNGGGNSGGNGRGGGGASDIRVGGTALNNRVVVAAGGGGGGLTSSGFTGSNGASGGGTTGSSSTASSGGGGLGGGGTQAAGGASTGCCGSGTAGNLGIGGNGANGMSGCSSYSDGWGGGGGGGYFGGGGGGNCGGGVGGGGGSSFIGGITGGTTTAGVRTGNGQVTLSWSGIGCVSSVTPVTVSVGVAPATNAGASVVDASTCGKNTVNLGANTLAAGEAGTWTLLSGTNANGIFSLPTASSTQFTGTYGGSYVLQWSVSNQSSGCTANDTLVVTFNQPVDAVINGLIGTSDLLWCGLTGTDWSTSTNWYQKQATSGLYPNGYYQRMSGTVQPAINNEVFTVSMANGGMCIGNNTPTLSINSNAEDVYVGPGITWNLSNDSINIAQNLVNNGTIIASTGITNFTGSSNSTISGSGTTQLFNMRVNKSAGATLTLQQPVLVTNNLNMVQGNVFTSSTNLLTLGTSSAAPGGLTYNAGTIVGPFKRYFANAASAGTAGLFPVGTAVYNRYADFSFGSGPGVDQFLTVEYKTGAPMQGGIPLYNGLPLMASGSMIQNYSADGYWSVIPTNNNYTAPITSVNYGVTLFANNLTGMQSPQVCRIIKSAGSNNAVQHHVAWQACGTHTPINGAANPQAFLITSTATQGFSWFNIGTPNSQALPVELLSFNGECNEGQVNLSWQTATEHNSDYFEVEKSRDGMNWQVLTTVNAAGNSTQLLNYEAIDANAMEGNNYYRLTQVDIDGTTKTYDVINVSCSGAAKGYFSAYPNPSTGSFQVILNDKNLVGSGILSVKDTKGSELLNRTIEVKPGINMFSVTEMNLAPGVYYIQIVNGERATEVLKEVIR